MVKIVTYNVNGIRSALQKGLLDWLTNQQPDIICLQEVKASENDINIELFRKIGYTHISWHEAQKKGYSGVAILSKYPFETYQKGFGNTTFDAEGRILTLSFPSFYLCTVYIPSGTSGEHRQGFKYEWLEAFDNFLANFPTDKPLIICGDFNICHTEKDIHNPIANKNSTGFLPEERAWLSTFFQKGYTDAFRYKNPDTISYTWWTYRFQARSRNLGWRIDYFAVSASANHAILNCYHAPEALHSDHCPVILEIDS